MSAGGQVRLDGLHALKHALRFGADVTSVMTDDPERALRQLADVAPDLVDHVAGVLQTVPTEQLRAQTEQLHSSHVVAVARRPRFDGVAATGPVIVLEAPRHLSNLGACVRVAAAADAAGVLTTGVSDPWHPMAVRTSAGLHFALPVHRYASMGELVGVHARAVIGVDPDGIDLREITIHPDSLLLFGTERAGLSDDALARCTQRVRIPMRNGVSSLNLATSVAALLYDVVLRRPNRLQ